MVTVEDCECVSRLLGNTISMLCKNALKFDKEIRVEGILGITVDRDVIFLVRVNEAFSKSDHDSEVRVKSASAADVNNLHPCRPPAARRLALMPPEMTSMAESSSSNLQDSSSVLAWPLETTASSNARQVPVARPTMPTLPSRGQVCARGRGAIRSHHVATTGPRFPIGRPRLNIPGNNHNVAARGLKPAIRAPRQRIPAPRRLPGTVTPRRMLPIESAKTMQQSVGRIVPAAFSPRGPQGQPPRKILALQSCSTNVQSPRNPSKAMSTVSIQQSPRGQGPQSQAMSIQQSPRSQGPQSQMLSIQQSPKGQGPQSQVMSIQQSPRSQGPQSQMMSIQQSPRGQRPQGQMLSILQSPRGQRPQSQVMRIQQSPRGQGPQSQMLSIQQSPRSQGPQSQAMSIQQSPRSQGPQSQMLSIQQSPKGQGPQSQMMSIQQSPKGQGLQSQMMSIQQSARGQRPQSQVMRIQQSPRGQGPQSQLMSIQQSPRSQGPQSQMLSIQQSPRSQGPQSQMMSIQQSPRSQGPQSQICIQLPPKSQGPQGQIISIQQSSKGQESHSQAMSIQQSPRGRRPQSQMMSIQQSPRGQGPQSQAMSIQQSARGQGPQSQIMSVQQSANGQRPQGQINIQQIVRDQGPLGHITSNQQSPRGQGPQGQIGNQQSPRMQGYQGQMSHKQTVQTEHQNQISKQSSIIHQSSCAQGPEVQMAQQHSPRTQLFNITQLLAIQRSQDQSAGQPSTVLQSSTGRGPQTPQANQLLPIQQSPTGPRPEAQFAQLLLSTQQSAKLQGLQGHTTLQQLTPVVHSRPVLHTPIPLSVQRFNVPLVNQLLSAQQSLRGQQPVANSFRQMQTVNLQSFIQQPSPSMFHSSIPGMSVASCLPDARSSSPVSYASSTGGTTRDAPSDVSSSMNPIILGAQCLYASVQPAHPWLPVQTVEGQFAQPQQFQQQQSLASTVPVLFQASQWQNTSGNQQNVFVPPNQSQFQSKSGPVQGGHLQCSQNQSQVMQSSSPSLSQHIADTSDHSDWLNKFIDEQLSKMPLVKQHGQQGVSTEVRTCLSQKPVPQTPDQQLVDSSPKSQVASHKISDKQKILSTTCSASPILSASTSSSTSCAALPGSSASTSLVSSVCVTALSSSVTVSSEKAATKAKKALRSSASTISLSALNDTRPSIAIAASRSKTSVKAKKKSKSSVSVSGTPSSKSIAVPQSKMRKKARQVAESKSAARDESNMSRKQVQSSRSLSWAPVNSSSHQSLLSPNRVSDDESRSSNTTIVSTSWCDLELGPVGEDNVSLHLSQTESSDDQSLLKCKARGCKAYFSKLELLAAHYSSSHLCDWGPPKDAVGLQLYREWKSRDVDILFNSMGKAVCRICKSQFIAEKTLRNHMSRMHGIKNSCSRP